MDKVKDTLRITADSLLGCKGKEVVVGWSGGGDSTALVLLLVESGAKVTALHVDHGWRESRDDVERLGALLESFGVEVVYREVDGKRDSNREGHARQKRYEAYGDFLKTHPSDFIFLAHNRDDQIETMVMRKMMSSGWRGLCGIREEAEIFDVKVRRPLLDVPGQSLRHYLSRKRIVWVEDPSNSDTTILRNRIRHEILPKMRAEEPGFEESLLKLRKEALLRCQLLDSHVSSLLSESKFNTTTSPSLVISRNKLRQVDRDLLVHFLQKVWGLLLGPGKIPGRRHVVSIEEWLSADGVGGLDLNGVRLERRKKNLTFKAVMPCRANSMKK